MEYHSCAGRRGCQYPPIDGRYDGTRDAIQSVSQTRDTTPNVLEVIAEQALDSSGEDDDGENDDGPVVSDVFREDAVITITMSDNMESQTMTMEYTEGGAERSHRLFT